MMTSSQWCLVTPEGKSQSLCVDEVKGKGNTVGYLEVLLQQESKLYPPCDDYLSEIQTSHALTDMDPVSESWRRKLCEWCFEVVDHFKASYFSFIPFLSSLEIMR